MNSTLAALLAGILLTGCSAEKAGRMATRTVTFAGKTVTKATVATVKTGTSVAMGTTKTVVKTTGTVVTEIAKAGFVTVKDVATGVSKQVPYSEGMRLYAATQTAKVDAYLKAFEIVRTGMVIRSDWKQLKSQAGNPVLKPGDVINVKHLASAQPKTVKRS